jgi:hypothetical protein
VAAVPEIHSDLGVLGALGGSVFWDWKLAGFKRLQ